MSDIAAVGRRGAHASPRAGQAGALKAKLNPSPGKVCAGTREVQGRLSCAGRVEREYERSVSCSVHSTGNILRPLPFGSLLC